VFISHTSELRNFPKGTSYVAAVERAISAAGHVIVDMADFAAADQAPARVCGGRECGGRECCGRECGGREFSEGREFTCLHDHHAKVTEKILQTISAKISLHRFLCKGAMLPR
jgi:hypothetical protein